MHILLTILAVCASIVLLVMLYNRLYFEIHLGRATKILNEQLKLATREQVKDFTNNLQEILDVIIDDMTNTYEETAKELSKLREEK